MNLYGITISQHFAHALVVAALVVSIVVVSAVIGAPRGF